MHKKEQVTRKELEQDLISALKQPAETPKSTYKKWTIPAVIIAIFFVVVISKKTGMITLAYNTALFEWRV